MLPAINRLKANRDFKSVFNGGKTAENRFFKIKFIKNREKETRFGFIISTKFAKKAVVRNLIKRRLRAAVRFLLKNIKPGFDIIVWPKKILEESNFKLLADGLKTLFIKNDLLSI